MVIPVDSIWPEPGYAATDATGSNVLVIEIIPDEGSQTNRIYWDSDWVLQTTTDMRTRDDVPGAQSPF